ncbi:hypothetical protein ACW7BJ_12055 [Azospirillum argentinense]
MGELIEEWKSRTPSRVPLVPLLVAPREDAGLRASRYGRDIIPAFSGGLGARAECKFALAYEGRNAAWRLLTDMALGDALIYHMGDLATDRYRDLFLHGFADVLQRAAEDGLVRLTQYRQADGDDEVTAYRVEKRGAADREKEAADS